MAQNNQLPSLLDMMKETGADGSLLDVVDLLGKNHPLIEDIVFQQGNESDGHTFAQTMALGTPTYRQFNQGILATAGLGESRTERATMLADRAAVDSDLLEKNGNSAAWRQRQESRNIEGVYQEVERGFFYNSTNLNPDRFMGLSPRLNATSGNPFANQIIKHTGSPSGSDQTSIWLVVHGLDSVYGIFPKGTKGGLQKIDLGEQLVDDGGGTGATFRAMVTEWKWNIGLCVQDGRQVVRICNIDTSALSATAFDIIPVMTRALHRVNNLRAGRPVFYMNRFMMEMLDLQCQNNSKALALADYVEEGKARQRDMSPSFRQVPIHTTDAITITEDAVS